jgi:hypothetical protein
VQKKSAVKSGKVCTTTRAVGARGAGDREASIFLTDRLTSIQTGGADNDHYITTYILPHDFSDHPMALRPERSKGFSLPLPYLQGGSFKKFNFSFLNLWISASIFLFWLHGCLEERFLFHQNFALWDILRY